MKELEDYDWFPSVLRNFQTEFIGFVVDKFRVYDAFVQLLQTMQLPKLPMTDLCSGSGEPAMSIFRKSHCFSRLTLTDKFPNAFNLPDEDIYYDKQSIDVLTMAFQPDRYYTMFNAFHHFTDEEKVTIVQDLQNSGATAFIVEILEPTVFCFLKVCFMTTIGSLVLTPFIRPFSMKRLLFTYLLPINIFTITFDGIVSVLKSRSVKQYQKLLAYHDNVIKVIRIKNGLTPLIIIQITGVK